MFLFCSILLNANSNSTASIRLPKSSKRNLRKLNQIEITNVCYSFNNENHRQIEVVCVQWVLCSSLAAVIAKWNVREQIKTTNNCGFDYIRRF